MQAKTVPLRSGSSGLDQNEAALELEWLQQQSLLLQSEEKELACDIQKCLQLCLSNAAPLPVDIEGDAPGPTCGFLCTAPA